MDPAEDQPIDRVSIAESEDREGWAMLTAKAWRLLDSLNDLVDQ